MASSAKARRRISLEEFSAHELIAAQDSPLSAQATVVAGDVGGDARERPIDTWDALMADLEAQRPHGVSGAKGARPEPTSTPPPGVPRECAKRASPASSTSGFQSSATVSAASRTSGGSVLAHTHFVALTLAMKDT